MAVPEADAGNAHLDRRLGVWMRLGIVITLLWVIIGTISFAVWQFNVDYKVAEKIRTGCETINARYPDHLPEDCWAEYMQLTRIDHSSVWWESFWVTIAMATIVWILFGIAYSAIRWILAGRKVESK